MLHSASCELNGQSLVIESGKMARQAHGSILAKCMDTVVLVAAARSKDIRENIDFLPLTVDYREKTSAVGKFPGGYIKREGRPTEKEILTARLIDRSIRPLFPKGYVNDLQVMSIVLSADRMVDPDVVAINAASAALTISDIPFGGPVGAVRVGMIEDELVVNPSHEQLKESVMDLVVAGTEGAVTMLEGHVKEIPEKTLAKAVFFAHEHIKKLVAMQHELREKCGVPKHEAEIFSVDTALQEKVSSLIADAMADMCCGQGKDERRQKREAFFKDNRVNEQILEAFPEATATQIKAAISAVEKKCVRDSIVNKNKRQDGRSTTDIRPISCEVGILPRTHGSALFTRGETQSLAIVTLGSASDEQKGDTLFGERRKSFMLFYNFPPFSVGETRPIRGPGRREIGHGMLAERALLPMMPSAEEFPYTIKLESEILESNGSSSMASVCSGTLAMMDAGVPIAKPVTGIAMGLIKDGDKVAILSDILGSEDALGDMDFKVTGTKDGITAIQMDVKIEGITQSILEDALAQALQGRLHILEKVEAVISTPREALSSYAPQIKTIHIKPEKIGMVIGPGGSMIRKIIEETGAEINIEDDGKVSLFASARSDAEAAEQMIKDLTAEAEVGKVYQGVVKNVVDFGCFVEILPGKEGLVHISNLANHRVASVSDEVKVGDKIEVKVIGIDERGRIGLSRKVLLDS